MYITTLTSPFVLRKYIIEDSEMQKLVGDQVFPVNAPEGTEGNFITMQRTGYDNGQQDGHNIETTTVEVELCSKDYGTACLFMLDTFRKLLITMRNAGIDARITDIDEYTYAFVQGGETWNVQKCVATLTNVNINIDISGEEPEYNNSDSDE